MMRNEQCQCNNDWKNEIRANWIDFEGEKRKYF